MSKKEQRAALIARAESLLQQKPYTHEHKSLFDSLMRLSQELAIEGETSSTDEERRAVKEVREYLKYGREAKTFRDLSVSLDGSGGYFVPQPFFFKVTAMLKAIDPMFDESLVTFYESEDGNAIPAPLISDENASASIVGEGVSGTPSTINAGRLFLAKAPTWRSGSLSFSVEIGMDSAFGLDDLVAAAVARRFRKGISAANVATLVSQAASALTTASLAAGVTLDNCADLLGSIDSDYLASPKFRVLMNHATLTS
jgi:HK97 family phage major capsid protein